MDINTITLFYFTCPDTETAQDLCTLLLERSLIACANIVNNLSTFSWNNKIENSKEVTVIAKTSNALTKEVEKLLLEKHPYQNPCILNFSVQSKYSYYEYIEQTTKKRATKKENN